MTALSYVDGEITTAKSAGPMIVAHVCNEVGIWIGKNAKMVSRRWPAVRFAYYRWYRNRIRNDFSSGAVQFIDLSKSRLNQKIRIANMVAQPDYRRSIHYHAFEKCLLAVSRKAKQIGATVHLPKIGSEQTESWPDLESIVDRLLCANRIDVFIYAPSPPLENQWFGSVIERRPRF